MLTATAAAHAASPAKKSPSRHQEAPAVVERRTAAASMARHRAAEATAAATARRAAAHAARRRSLRKAVGTIETEKKSAAAAARDAAVNAERHKKPAKAALARAEQAALSPASGSLSAHARAQAQLTRPVLGRVLHRWGEKTDAGPATGLSYQASPSARVVAPCSGRVAFADAFRSYGLLLILDCGGGYHTVLSGFDHLGVAVGHKVRAGETIGTMPASAAATAGRQPVLYVELRHDGQPVNPAPWIKPAS